MAIIFLIVITGISVDFLEGSIFCFFGRVTFFVAGRGVEPHCLFEFGIRLQTNLGPVGGFNKAGKALCVFACCCSLSNGESAFRPRPFILAVFAAFIDATPGLRYCVEGILTASLFLAQGLRFESRSLLSRMIFVSAFTSFLSFVCSPGIMHLGTALFCRKCVFFASILFYWVMYFTF